MARHPRWKGVGLSTNPLLVVECDGPIASERITRAFDRFLDVCPWPAARLRRFPWGKLHWAAGARPTLTGPPLRRATVTPKEQPERELLAELKARIQPPRAAAPPLLLLDAAGGEARPPPLPGVTWFH